jgi:hypothetical protein
MHAKAVKWAFQASPRETSSFLVEKGKRDARAWVAATGLADLLVGRTPAPAAEAGKHSGGAAEAAARERGAAAGPGVVLPAGWGPRGGEAAAVEAERRRQQEAGAQPSTGAAEAAPVDGAAPAGAAAASNGVGTQERHGHKRRRDEAVEGAEEPFVPGLTGLPRTDTAPMHDKAPA